ncbi:hypothetical protein [Streptomyces curacoi]|uniref:Uncharacterized protein n=1 Tax=Streptomyces curacoi TaxID=146536 RepID=A0A117NTJ7_9ACTN|nr:hypothetical protein [Streptomyces curacoi]KUM67167.1 hypothetical protein AQI70_36535 [Streptomyces curacoi]
MREPAGTPLAAGPARPPFTTHPINPRGDRHLGCNVEDGRFFRLWQHKSPPEPPHTGQAILLRPSDIDQTIQFSML